MKDKIKVLRDYCAEMYDCKVDDMLHAWSKWMWEGIDKIGYKRPAYAKLSASQETENWFCIYLNDDEMEVIDKAIGRIQRKNDLMFRVILERYVHHHSLRLIAKTQKFKSTNKVYTILNNAKSEFACQVQTLLKETQND